MKKLIKELKFAIRSGRVIDAWEIANTLEEEIKKLGK